MARIRQLLQSIDNRLARLERRQSAPICCPQDASGNPIPILQPREEPTRLRQEDDTFCLRLAGALRKTVWDYNATILRVKDAQVPDLTPFVFLEAALFQLGAAVNLYLTQIGAQRLLDAVTDYAADELTIPDENINWCTAVRQYVAGDEPPDAIIAAASVPARVAFAVWYNFIGGVAWSAAFDLANLPVPDGITAQCCMPEQFSIFVAPGTLVCGSSTYTLDMVQDTAPYVPGVVVATGVLSRAAIATRYLWSVESPGRFSLKLWYSNTPDVSVSCNNHDRVLSGGTNWRVAQNGSPYLVIRNITDYEGTYLICSREPYDSRANIEDI